MPLIWRGLGIVVPIIFFITAWIVSYWYDSGETTLGNSSYIGWTALFAGIVVLLIGLGLMGGSSDEEDGPRKKHDFFYLPVFAWGLLLGALSLYLLVFAGKPATEDATTSDSENSVVEEVIPTTRMVNFYNPTSEILTYIVADDVGDGLISREKVEPMSFKSLELKKGTYLFTAFNGAKETTLLLPPDKEIASDTTKYTMHKDDKGPFFQRILNPATKETDDYDAAWLVLNGTQDMLLLNVTAVCNESITKEDIFAINWEDEIQERYDARDLIEPLFKQFKKGMQIKVVEPGQKIPSKIAEDEVYYFLTSDPKTDLISGDLAKAVSDARF
jgi:hypothetical protein